MSSSKDQWDKAHASTKNSAIPSSLYTDENPATTIKGCGFKNERIAKRTIELTSQPGVRYKQYWTIRAMRERAAYHPHKTAGIRDAIVVFDEWLKNYKEPSERDKQLYQLEWQEFRTLCQTNANKHSYGKNPTNEELKRAREDFVEGQKIFMKMLQSSSVKISFPLTSFVAVFGGPGIHGYGRHEITSDQDISHVNINGNEGIEELIGATKVFKLSIGDDVDRVQLTYNRREETCMASIVRSKKARTLENLWEKSTCKPSKRSKIHEKSEEKKGAENSVQQWICHICTFAHVGNSKKDFLVCELCGSTRLTGNVKE